MADLTDQEIEQLVMAAVDARGRAYAPHSHFDVGAAILTDDQRITSGCNVENASFGLTICAERVAASAAVAAGYREWKALAIASTGGVAPCGACRQFLAEFGLDVTIVLINVTDGSRRVCHLSQLLPEAFGEADLPIQG